MTADFIIATEWLDDDAATASEDAPARLHLAIGGNIASRAENRWSQTIVEAVPLSAGTLATWLIGSWWRLRHEPGWPVGRPPTGWRMAHEIAAAGGGFLWPRLRIMGDGVSMEFDCIPSDPRCGEAIVYLGDFRAQIDVDAFEGEVDGFVERVVERLGATGRVTNLAEAWRRLGEERHDPAMTEIRRIEAMLGYDPAEAPEELLRAVTALGQQAGDPGEIAAMGAVAPPDRIRLAVEAASLPGSIGLRGRPKLSGQPHQHGYKLARWAREQAHIRPGEPVRHELAELLGMSAETLTSGTAAPAAAEAAPMSVMVRNGARARFLFRPRAERGRRFDAARLIGDTLGMSERPWQIASDTKTARQKLQRAFAAEFLAPIDALRARLDADPSDDAIADAASHFGVGELLVRSQLVNHGDVERERWTLAT